ncbi:MAG: DUF885 domain-containing protein, partial [Clostridiales Family XIII bacterium]|nr:DUF885 domain-containing protein [Clostridiales Family XIII bacterium]
MEKIPAIPFKKRTRAFGARAAAVLLALLLVSSLFAGCAQDAKEEPPGPPRTDAAAFDQLAEDLFRHYASADSLSLNYTVASPKGFGITPPEPTFGDFSIEGTQKEIEYSREALTALEAIDVDKLNQKQRLTRDILLDTLRAEAEYADGDFLLYGELLSPTIGLQANLPVLLAEYHLYDKMDIDPYIELLKTLPDAVSEIIGFEKEKKAKGLFMAKSAAQDVIGQIDEFTAETDGNLLIEVFDERMDEFPGLTDEERARFKKENRAAVLDAVIPAYQTLRDALEELNKDNKRTEGLGALPKGEAYYRLLVRGETGSSWSVEDMEARLEALMTERSEEMMGILYEDEEVLSSYYLPPWPEEDPEKILKRLQKKILGEFPPLENADYTLKYVHSSLEEYASPAFYLTPPIDDTSNNVIYINRLREGEGGPLFPLLAHEGYPGHLYQIVYFKRFGGEPVRDILDFSGYNEGWATYVEQLAYGWAGLDKDLVTVLSDDNLLSLCLYAVSDIKVNFRGWDQKQLAGYLDELGYEGDEVAGQIYDS